MTDISSTYIDKYDKALYRRNNFGQPTVWNCVRDSINSVHLYHGIVGKTITHEFVNTKRKVEDEIKSRVNAKRKVGYKYLSELKDNVIFPVEGELLHYLNKYLPDYRTSKEGNLLAMKAKTYDNTNNRVFKKCSCYIGQWKINGLRCFIGATKSNDIFNNIKLTFQSNEGTYWNSLGNLEEYLLEIIPYNIINKMIEECYILDGELYLPGYKVSAINHFVKDVNCPENKLIQFWCYDIAIENTMQYKRLDYLMHSFNKHIFNFTTKDAHLSNDKRFGVLVNTNITNDKEATDNRDNFIDLGFEGLIMRNPFEEYQYGKRNMAMIKYKNITDGKFTIVDIYSEGIKRPNIPLLLVRNDINNETFEIHIGGSQEYQASILKNKDMYIGKDVFIEYGERSGVKQVPFHIKDTYIIE